MGFMLGINSKICFAAANAPPKQQFPCSGVQVPHPLAISQGVDFDLAALNSTEDTLVVAEKA